MRGESVLMMLLKIRLLATLSSVWMICFGVCCLCLARVFWVHLGLIYVQLQLQFISNILHFTYATIFNFNLRKILHQNKKIIFVTTEELKIHNTYFNVKFQLRLFKSILRNKKNICLNRGALGHSIMTMTPVILLYL